VHGVVELHGCHTRERPGDADERNTVRQQLDDGHPAVASKAAVREAVARTGVPRPVIGPIAFRAILRKVLIHHNKVKPVNA
jgi:hypothetical protein